MAACVELPTTPRRRSTRLSTSSGRSRPTVSLLYVASAALSGVTIFAYRGGPLALARIRLANQLLAYVPEGHTQTRRVSGLDGRNLRRVHLVVRRSPGCCCSGSTSSHSSSGAANSQAHPDGSVSVRTKNSSATSPWGTSIRRPSPPTPRPSTSKRSDGSACPATSAPSSSAVFWRAGVLTIEGPGFQKQGFRGELRRRRPTGRGATGLGKPANIDDIRAAAELIVPTSCAPPWSPAGWADDVRPFRDQAGEPAVDRRVQGSGAFNAIGHLDEVRGGPAARWPTRPAIMPRRRPAYAAAVERRALHTSSCRRRRRTSKAAATRSHGAGGGAVRCRESARRSPPRWLPLTGGALVPPFDHPDIIAGQGTIGLEIAEDLAHG